MEEKFNKKIEEAMCSINGIEKASLPPFFFTKLEARLQKEKNSWERLTSFIAQPAVVFASICLIIMINAIVIFSSSNKTNLIAQQTNELTTVDEYSQVSTTTLYEFENIKP